MKELYKYASFTALGAGLSMILMLTVMTVHPEAITLWFEQVTPVHEYVAMLKKAEQPLRLIQTIDNVFLILACATFLLIATILRNEKSSFITSAVIIPILLTCYLDIYENHHIIMMLNSAVQNIPISQEEIQWQYIASLLKFHGGNLNYFLLAFFFPHKTTLEKYFRLSLLFLLLPFSVIRYSYGEQIGISIMPFIPIALGLLIVSYIFYRRYSEEK